MSMPVILASRAAKRARESNAKYRKERSARNARRAHAIVAAYRARFDSDLEDLMSKYDFVTKSGGSNHNQIFLLNGLDAQYLSTNRLNILASPIQDEREIVVKGFSEDDSQLDENIAQKARGLLRRYRSINFFENLQPDVEFKFAYGLAAILYEIENRYGKEAAKEVDGMNLSSISIDQNNTLELRVDAVYVGQDQFQNKLLRDLEWLYGQSMPYTVGLLYDTTARGGKDEYGISRLEDVYYWIIKGDAGKFFDKLVSRMRDIESFDFLVVDSNPDVLLVYDSKKPSYLLTRSGQEIFLVDLNGKERLFSQRRFEDFDSYFATSHTRNYIGPMDEIANKLKGKGVLGPFQVSNYPVAHFKEI